MKIATILVVAISLATAFNLQGKVCKEFCNSIVVPDGWEEISRAGKSEIIRLHIGLKLRNTELLEEIVLDVSDPESKNYGKHLTFAELHEIVAPSARALSDVTGWLESRRLSYQVAESKDWIIVDLTVDAAEQLLSTEFYNFRHTSGQHLIRSYGPYFIPQELDAHIDLIGGILRFPKVRTLRVAKSVAERQMDGLYPGLIKQAFNMPANIAGQSSKNSQAVAQFAVYAQYFDQSDLTLFQQTYNLTQQSPQVFGPNDPNNPGDEAMLDIEYIMGMAENVESWFVSTNGTANGGQEPFLDWIVAQKNNPNSPWVHSISYGDSENTVSLSYAVRCTQEFQIFGASGRTLFFASGDDGANCNGSTFDANFPAASPYVTSVGGITTSDSYARQANQFIADEISSGGFSDYFSRPAYQAAAVQNYLTTQRGNLPPSGQYNSTGRGFPDIASFSENINIALGGGITPVAGTSCAAPVIAGVFSLLNDARFMKGKSSIGFANPLIYNLLSNHPDAFQDVTTGSNEGCDVGNGFPAAPGWDAVTGVGAPNFPSLLTYVLQYAKN